MRLIFCSGKKAQRIQKKGERKMCLKVKPIEKKDWQDICLLIEAVNRSDHLDYSLTKEWFDYVLHHSENGLFVAHCKEQLVGLATCMVNTADKGQGVINLIVHPENRKEGVGTALYHRLIEYATETKIEKVFTYVNEALVDALKFVEKKDFTIILYSWKMEMDLTDDHPVLSDHKNIDGEIIFRKAVPSDGNAYRHIIADCFGDYIGDNALEQLLRDPSVRVYLLKYKGDTVASITIQYKENIAQGYLYDVAVIKKYRGRGFGKCLLQRSLLMLKKYQMKTAALLVSGENREALRLYESVGFREVGLDYVMEKKIT